MLHKSSAKLSIIGSGLCAADLLEMMRTLRLVIVGIAAVIAAFVCQM
jgi:hypothetical protein